MIQLTFNAVDIRTPNEQKRARKAQGGSYIYTATGTGDQPAAFSNAHLASGNYIARIEPILLVCSRLSKQASPTVTGR